MTCAICFCDITAATGKTVLGCKHEFHLKCIGTWLLGSADASCPCCRAAPGELETLSAPHADDESVTISGSDSDDDSLPETTPLMQAAQEGDVHAIQQLLANPSTEVDTADAEGDTALLYACVNDEREAAAALLAAGADINHKDNRGNTALMSVIECDDTDVATVALLLEHGADATIEDSLHDTPLEKAAFMGKAGVVELLLERGLGRMDAALYGACRRGNLECATILLNHGADPNGRHDLDRLTPLMGAVCSKQGVVELLLMHGADVNAVDREGLSVFLWATQNANRNRRMAIMRLLLRASYKTPTKAAVKIQAVWKGFTVRRVHMAAQGLLALG